MTTDATRHPNLIRDLPWWVRAIDWFMVAYGGLTLYVLMFGGFRFHVAWLGGWRVSAGDPIKLFAELILMVIARHWIYRRVSLRAHLGAERVRIARALQFVTRKPMAWPRGLWVTIAIALATRLAVLFIGVVAVNMIGFPEDARNVWRVSKSDVLNLPARWDSGWYLGIAQTGYEWDPNIHGQQNLVFFPAYPMLTRAVSAVFFGTRRDPVPILWAGVIVSVLAFTGALVYLYLLARDRLDEDAAITAVTLQAVYPFALFFGAMYTESLFLLAATGAFYHFSRKHFWWTAAYGVLIGLVRPNGFMIACSLALMALAWWHGPLAGLVRRLPRFIRGEPSDPPSLPWPDALLAIAAPALGLAIYCAFIYWLTGNPFMWSKLQSAWNRNFNGLANVRDSVALLNDWGLISYMAVYPMDILNGLAMLFGIATIWPVTRRFGLPFGLFVLLNLSLPILAGGLESVGRYSSVLFPSFLWLGMATPRSLRPLVIALFAAGLGLAAAMFFTWRSMF